MKIDFSEIRLFLENHFHEFGMKILQEISNWSIEKKIEL